MYLSFLFQFSFVSFCSRLYFYINFWFLDFISFLDSLPLFLSYPLVFLSHRFLIYFSFLSVLNFFIPAFILYVSILFVLVSLFVFLIYIYLSLPHILLIYFTFSPFLISDCATPTPYSILSIFQLCYSVIYILLGFPFLSYQFLLPFPSLHSASLFLPPTVPLFPLDVSIFSMFHFPCPPIFLHPTLYFLFLAFLFLTPFYPSLSHPLSIHFSIPSIPIPDWFSEPFSYPRGRAWWSLGPITGFLRENLRGKRTGCGGGWGVVRWKRWIREFRGGGEWIKAPPHFKYTREMNRTDEFVKRL